MSEGPSEWLEWAEEQIRSLVRDGGFFWRHPGSVNASARFEETLASADQFLVELEGYLAESADPFV